MTPEEQALLKRVAELSEENNIILHKMQRSGRLSLWAKISYWALILVLSVAAYYGFQGYIQSLQGDFNSTSSSAGSTQDSSNPTSTLTNDISTLKSLN